MTNSYEWAFEHVGLSSVLTEMTFAHVAGTELSEISDKELRTACFVASHLSTSPLITHRKKAQLFAALAYSQLPQSKQIQTVCYAIFARTGAIPAARHLHEVVGDKQQFIGGDLGLLSSEFNQTYLNYYTPLAGGTVVTEFQKEALHLLADEQRAIFSAPTSAGKSFVVHESLKLRLGQKGKFFALLIVPTKALISQFASLYRRFQKESDLEFPILTSIPDGLEVNGDKAVFVLTQERCIRLLSSNFATEIDFIFSDEIQSLEQTSRGALLEYILSELEMKSPTAQIFAAGPYIKNVGRLAGQIFVEQSKELSTDMSPVSQILVQLAPVKEKKEIALTVLDDRTKEQDNTVFIPSERKLFSRWKTNYRAVTDSVKLFGRHSSSIVYTHGPKTAQNWAKKYVELINEEIDVSDSLWELIDYLDESIHPQCSLIEGLKCGVAYHHSGLPDFVREEIEERFAERDIKTLFCTSTLLEGVNLPTEKIFLVSPKKASEDLSDFEFNNLIGRAGRLNEHLSGTIYCVHSPNDSDGVDENWVEKYRKRKGKYVQPAIENHLRNSFEEILSVINSGQVLTPEDDRGVELRPTITLLRSKFFADSEEAVKYLQRKNISESDKTTLIAALTGSMDGLEIAEELVVNNPYIDPFLQDKLFQLINNNPEAWKIRSKRGFSKDLKETFKLLDEVFCIVEDINPRGNNKIYRDQLLRFSKKWLFGTSFKELVESAIPKKIRNSDQFGSKDVDDAIVKVTDFINKGVSYQMAKYYSLVSDILKVVLPEDEQSDYALIMGLSTMLELGCNDPKALALMTACVPRSTALRVAKDIPETDSPLSWLAVNQNNPVFQSLPSIHTKILKRTGVWV